MAVSIIYAFYPVHFYFSCNVDAVKSFTFFIIWIASRSYLYAFSFFFLPSFVLLCIFWFWKVYVPLLSRMVIGYDEGTIMIKMGREVPVASMDTSGKIIWAKHNEIQTVNIKTVGAGFEVSWSLFIIKWDNWKGLADGLSCFANQVTDGERLPLAVKELGSCDLYPQVLLDATMLFAFEICYYYRFIVWLHGWTCFPFLFGSGHFSLI